MQRNDFDTFDELVRGKLTGYIEPPDQESLSRIHVKKARVTSLYQLYRLMMVLLVAGIGMLASTLLFQNPSTIEGSPSVNKGKSQPSTQAAGYTVADQAEFASQQNNLLSPANNISLSNKDEQFSRSSNDGNRYSSSINTSSVENRTNTTRSTSVSVSKSNTSITAPLAPQSLPIQPSSPLKQETEKGDPNLNVDKNDGKNTPATDRLDSLSKNSQKDETCNATFDFYTSYNGEYTFRATGNSNTSKLTWNFGDGQTSSDPSPVHTFDGSGTYTVTLVLTDNGKKCTSKASKEIVLEAKHAPKQPLLLSGSLFAGTDMVSNGTIEVYTLDEQTFKYNSTFIVKTKVDGSFNIPLTAGVRYLLKGYPTEANRNYQPTFWGNTVSNDDASEIMILPGEHLDIIGYNIQLVANEQTPEERTLANTPAFPAESQVVLFDANNNIVGIGHLDQNGNIVPSPGIQPGSYTAVNPASGKTSSVAISNSGVVSSISTPVPSDDDKVAVFPNPANNTVNFGINSTINDNATLVVVNAAGFELMRKSIQFTPGFNQLQYDISAFPPGIYYVMVFKDNQKVMSNRIVKMGELGK